MHSAAIVQSAHHARDDRGLICEQSNTSNNQAFHLKIMGKSLYYRRENGKIVWFDSCKLETGFLHRDETVQAILY